VAVADSDGERASTTLKFTHKIFAKKTKTLTYIFGPNGEMNPTDKESVGLIYPAE
jgi:hypothetical protein